MTTSASDPQLAPVQQPTTTVAPKNPLLHAVVSAFVPGVGSMMAGYVGLGVFLLLACWAGIPLMWFGTIAAIAAAGMSMGPGPASGGEGAAVALMFIFAGIASFAIWVTAIWHGYYSAREWNRDRGITS